MSNNIKSTDDSFMTVHIATVAGTHFHFTMPKTATVEELKAFIAVQHNIPADQQHLIFQNQLLHTGPLTDAGVVNDSVLHLAAAMTTGPFAPREVLPSPHELITQSLQRLTDDQIALLMEQKAPVTFTAVVGQHVVVFNFYPGGLQQQAPSPTRPSRSAINTASSTDDAAKIEHPHEADAITDSMAQRDQEIQMRSKVDQLKEQLREQRLRRQALLQHEHLSNCCVVSHVSSHPTSSLSSISSMDTSLSVPVAKINTPTGEHKSRCRHCHKKLSLASPFRCRCGGEFCAAHRLANDHHCSYDYKTSGRRSLAEANPQILPAKLPLL